MTNLTAVGKKLNSLIGELEMADAANELDISHN
jgi:hypothetical protein